MTCKKINNYRSLISEATNELGLSDIKLSVKTYKGHPYLVDNKGMIIRDVTSIALSGGVEDYTTAKIEFVVE